ncbi:exosortase-associated EpsI family protein, partial [Halobellus sp. Atlit-31R]
GWLFFGVIMFIMFWIGSYWREDDQPAPAAAAAAPAAPAVRVQGAARSLVPMALAVVILCAVWPAFAAFNERANHNAREVVLPEPKLSWPFAAGFADWQVRYMEPDAQLARAYSAPDGRPVKLQLLYYRNQSKQKGLISSVNRLAGEKDVWHETATSLRTEAAG